MFTSYLTGSVHNKNLDLQRKLLLNDLFACGEQRLPSLSENHKYLYQCLRGLISHCDSRRRKSLEYIHLSRHPQSPDNSHQDEDLHVLSLHYVVGAVFTSYLTGSVHNKNLDLQRKLLLNDLFACGEQRLPSLSENHKYLYQCLRGLISHCDSRRRKSLEYIQLAQGKSQTHCTSIFFQGVDISSPAQNIEYWDNEEFYNTL